MNFRSGTMVLALAALPCATHAAPAPAKGPVCYTQSTAPDNVVLPKPKYPTMRLPEIHLPDAATRREPVTVLLQVTVSAEGRVDRIVIAEGSKVPDWDAGVRAASKDWSFVPGTEDAEPVQMCIKFRVTATLQE